MFRKVQETMIPFISRHISLTAGFLAMGLALYLLLSEYGARMFWPNMLCAGAIAIMVYYYQMRRGGLPADTKLISYVLPRHIWLHRSAMQDYWIVLINYVLILTILPVISLHEDTLKGWAGGVLDWLALEPAQQEAGWLIISFYTLAAFLLSDLGYYWAHRLMHRFPLLWEFHKLHHSAEVLTPVTLHRAHPVDIWLSVLGRTIPLGITSGIFFYFYPTMQGAYTIAGVNAGIFFFHIITGNLNHSYVWLPYGRVIEHIFLSPAQHHIHHSTNPMHFDKNFGSCWAVWDWLFGSLYIVEKKEDIVFGLTPEEMARYPGLSEHYIMPFVDFGAGFKKKIAALRSGKSGAESNPPDIMPAE